MKHRCATAQKNLSKRLVSLLLGVTLCISLLPAHAFAAISATGSSWDESLQIPKSLDFSELGGSEDEAEARLSAANAPSITSIKAISATQIQLSWSVVSGAQEYRIYRQSYTEDLATWIGSTKTLSFVDSSAHPGTMYRYVVVAAFSSTVFSDKSKYASVTTPPKNTTAYVTATFPKGVTVKWSAAEGANHYYVYRATKGSNSFQIVHSSTITSFVDTTAAGKKYVYKVQPLFVYRNHVRSQAAQTPLVSSDSGSWAKSGNTKKFVFSNGKTAKGWQLIAGKWYCFSSLGKLLKNAFKVTNGKKYYLGKNGTLKTGWITKNGKSYYCLSGGGVAKGWATIGNKEYYFTKSGILAKNRYVDNKHLNAKGYWDGKVKSGSSIGTVKDTRALLPLVNKARKKVGASTLMWNTDLAATARLRAIEIKKLFSHTRPNGTICFTAFPSYLSGAGENIAYGQRSVSAVNIAWTNSPGHYSNMVNSMFNCFGAACFTINGTKYWVELFGVR